MTTRKFNRGISDDFVSALNGEYRKGGWWRNLVDDQGTFLAIRNDSVNVYYRGCSLIRLEFNNNRLQGYVHYKYLVHPDLGDAKEYIPVLGGMTQLEDHRSLIFLEDLANVGRLKDAVEPYAEEEKKGVQEIIRNNPNVLDVEVAISDTGTAPRIDLAALHEVDGRVEVRFYEAKLFSNPELRASQRDPKVIDQIGTYSRLLSAQRTDIEASYLKVCCNLSALDGVAERHPERDELLKSIAAGSARLHINTKPHLLVFDFDADQRDGVYWKPHRDKLQAELGGRLKMRGKAQDLILTN